MPSIPQLRHRLRRVGLPEHLPPHLTGPVSPGSPVECPSCTWQRRWRRAEILAQSWSHSQPSVPRTDRKTGNGAVAQTSHSAFPSFWHQPKANGVCSEQSLKLWPLAVSVCGRGNRAMAARHQGQTEALEKGAASLCFIRVRVRALESGQRQDLKIPS